MEAIDTTSSVLGNIHNVLDAGYHGIIRYVSPNTGNFPNKCLTADEVAAIFAVSGMAIGLVHEAGVPTTVGYFTVARADANAADALNTVGALNVPTSVPVFFTVDYDPSVDDIAGPITDYFTAVHGAFSGAGRLIGVYSSGAACKALLAAGVVHFTWLSQSTGFNGYEEWKPQADIVQGPESQVAGLDVDTDEVVNEAVLWTAG
jgi:hypothetical protein